MFVVHIISEEILKSVSEKKHSYKEAEVEAEGILNKHFRFMGDKLKFQENILYLVDEQGNQRDVKAKILKCN